MQEHQRGPLAEAQTYGPEDDGRHPHAALIARAEAAARAEAERRWGPGPYDVRGDTRRGCCVHLVVMRPGASPARWRYELDGRITDDPSAWPIGQAEQSDAEVGK
jgi:hypothetical protein